MAKRIEFWPEERLAPYTRNARTHSDDQIAQIAASIAEFGFNNPVLVDTDAGIIARHGRVLAARKFGPGSGPCGSAGRPAQRRKSGLTSWRTTESAENAGWDDEMLRGRVDGSPGMPDLDLRTFWASVKTKWPALLAEPPETARGDDEAPRKRSPRCQSSRSRGPATSGSSKAPPDLGTVVTTACLPRLFDGAVANMAITSPPYASQRAYDPSSQFRPVPPGEYVAWFREVAANIAAFLAPDGSYFLNIKEHADGGQRNPYVKKLTIAHVEQWGWRFVDELCWRKTDDGVPGGWETVQERLGAQFFNFAARRRLSSGPGRSGTGQTTALITRPAIRSPRPAADCWARAARRGGRPR